MRMRFKPYAHDELMAADFHVHEPLIWGGKWHGQYARPEQPFVCSYSFAQSLPSPNHKTITNDYDYFTSCCPVCSVGRR